MEGEETDSVGEGGVHMRCWVLGMACWLVLGCQSAHAEAVVRYYVTDALGSVSVVMDEAGEVVEERLGSGSWVQSHNAAGTSRAVSGKTTGSWNYRVRACNDAGCSGWSSTATVAVTRPPTSAPGATGQEPATWPAAEAGRRRGPWR